MPSAMSGEAWTPATQLDNSEELQRKNSGGEERSESNAKEEGKGRRLKKRILLAGLDGAGKSRLAALMSTEQSVLDSAVVEFVFPTALPVVVAPSPPNSSSAPPAEDPSALYQVHCSHLQRSHEDEWALQSQRRKEKGKDKEEEKYLSSSARQYYSPATTAEGRSGKSTSTASGAANPPPSEPANSSTPPPPPPGDDHQHQHPSDAIELVDISGRTKARHYWRQFYGQHWLINEQLAGGGSGGSEEGDRGTKVVVGRRDCKYAVDGLIFVISGEDIVRTHLAWSELLCIVQDLSMDPIPVLVVVAIDRSVGVSASTTVSQGMMGYRSIGFGSEQLLDTAHVLRMVEDMAPFPSSMVKYLSFLDFDMTSGATARNGCHAVGKWCLEVTW